MNAQANPVGSSLDKEGAVDDSDSAGELDTLVEAGSLQTDRLTAETQRPNLEPAVGRVDSVSVDSGLSRKAEVDEDEALLKHQTEEQGFEPNQVPEHAAKRSPFVPEPEASAERLESASSDAAAVAHPADAESQIRADQPSSGSGFDESPAAGSMVSNLEDHQSDPLVKASPQLDVSTQPQQTAKKQLLDRAVSSDLLDAAPSDSAPEAKPLPKSEKKQRLIERLKPEQVPLDGDWDLAKWCYWIDQAGLEPSVASLAKKGVMQGSITGKSQLSFPTSSKIMVEAMGGKLKSALEQSLSGIEVVYEFGVLSSPTPEVEQNKRKRLVQQQAEHYLAEEDLVRVLKQTYQAELSGVLLSLDE